MARSWIYCNQFSCLFLVVFGRWSSGKKTHDPRRASRVSERTVGVSSRSITVTNKADSKKKNRGSFSGLHLVVGRHHRRRSSRFPHGLQLSRDKVLLADQMHTSS